MPAKAMWVRIEGRCWRQNCRLPRRAGGRWGRGRRPSCFKYGNVKDKGPAVRACTRRRRRLLCGHRHAATIVINID